MASLHDDQDRLDRAAASQRDYWDVVGALSDVIDIYEGPESFGKPATQFQRVKADVCRPLLPIGGLQ